MLEQRAIPSSRLMPGAEPGRGLCLAVDDFAAARALTERLLAAGHRHLAFIAGPPDHLAARARREGFEAALPPARRARRGSAKATSSSPRASARPPRCSPAPTARPRCSPPTTAWPPARSGAAAALGLSVPRDSPSPVSTIRSSPA
jgi:LacI family transcriptional regulator